MQKSTYSCPGLDGSKIKTTSFDLDFSRPCVGNGLALGLEFKLHLLTILIQVTGLPLKVHLMLLVGADKLGLQLTAQLSFQLRLVLAGVAALAILDHILAHGQTLKNNGG